MFVAPSGFATIMYAPSATPGINIHACTNTSCTTGVTTNIPGVRSIGDAEMRLDGRPAYFYVDNLVVPNALKMYDCVNSQCTAGTVRQIAPSVALFTNSAISPDGALFVSFTDTSTNTNKIARCSDANCISIVSTVSPAAVFSLAVRANNLASFLDGQGNLHSCTTTLCPASTIAEAANGFLAFAPDGRAIINDFGNGRLVTCLRSTCAF